jgi:hypothetical protein
MFNKGNREVIASRCKINKNFVAPLVDLPFIYGRGSNRHAEPLSLHAANQSFRKRVICGLVKGPLSLPVHFPHSLSFARSLARIPSLQDVSGRTFLKVYMELGSYFLFLQTNKRNHHHLRK